MSSNIQIERRQLAEDYRSHVRLENSVVTPELEARFSTMILKYKGSVSLYPGGRAELTPHDQTQIHEMCTFFSRYAEALLMRDQAAREHEDPWIANFVKFCLRSCAGPQDAREWVRIFVEYPDEVDALMRATLDKRIGAVMPRMLSIQRSLEGQEALCMQVDGTWRSLQLEEPGNISLQNRVQEGAPGYQISLEDLFKQFEAQRRDYTHVEVFADVGVLNWNDILLGSYNAETNQVDQIDLGQANWIYHLPVWKRASAEEVQNRYPNQIHWDGVPHEERFGLVICATRISPNRNISENHGFLELVIPEPNTPGVFRILPIGFQPPTIADTDCEKLTYIQSVNPCMLYYPDASGYFSQRQRYAEFFPISPLEFQETQRLLGHFAEKGRAGKEVFQPSGTNCARHVQKIYDRVIGKRFYSRFESLAATLLEQEPAAIQRQIKKISKNLDEEALDILAKEVVNKLFDANNIERANELFTLCLNTIQFAFANHSKASEIDIEDLRQKMTATFADQNAQVQEQFKGDFCKLIRFAFESQQFYKISIWDIDIENPWLGGFFTFVKGCSVEWLRSGLLRLCLFLLGSWRSYSYEKADGTVKTLRMWNHPFHAQKLQLPAKIFDRPQEAQAKIDALGDLFTETSNEPQEEKKIQDKVFQALSDARTFVVERFQQLQQQR
jgi:hypothetical protein